MDTRATRASNATGSGPNTAPPRTTLTSSKRARVSEEAVPVERARGSGDPVPMEAARGSEEPAAMERPIAPPAPPPTCLAGPNNMAKAAAAKATTSPKAGHRLPPGVTWDDL